MNCLKRGLKMDELQGQIKNQYLLWKSFEGE
jgi:hypothetical protein